MKSTVSHPAENSGDIDEESVQAVIAAMHDAPLHLLRRTLQRYTRAWQNAVPNLSAPQFAVLLAISRIEGLNQSRLSEITAIDPATLAELLARLEKKGVLRRIDDPRHRRRNLLEITDAGREELRAAEAHEASVRDEMFGALSGEEQRMFIAILNKLIS
jgi:MarR family transcriptional regulator, temperature-dependent positive regulator of motility